MPDTATEAGRAHAPACECGNWPAAPCFDGKCAGCFWAAKYKADRDTMMGVASLCRHEAHEARRERERIAAAETEIAELRKRIDETMRLMADPRVTVPAEDDAPDLVTRALVAARRFRDWWRDNW